MRAVLMSARERHVHRFQVQRNLHAYSMDSVIRLGPLELSSMAFHFECRPALSMP
jgi:hypothetical protein